MHLLKHMHMSHYPTLFYNTLNKLTGEPSSEENFRIQLKKTMNNLPHEFHIKSATTPPSIKKKRKEKKICL